MFAFLRKWLAPPVFVESEEKTWKARLLNVILLALFAIAFVYLVFAPIEPALWGQRLLIIGPFLLVVTGLWWAMRRGFVRFTGEAIVLALWAMFTLAMGFGAGYNNPAYMGYVVVVVCAGLLLGQRATIVWAWICVITSFIILQAAERGILAVQPGPPTGAAHWVAQTMYILVSAILLSLAIRSIEEAIIQARQELSERKRAEAALSASESRLRMVLDNLGEGVCVQDKDWNYTYANPAAHNILGWPSRELVGKNENDVLPPKGRTIVKQENIHRRVGQITSYETDILRPNGEIRTVLATGVPRLDAQGELVETFVAFTDITERKQLERALQEERDFVLQIINNMGQGLTVTDEEGQFILVNSTYARMTGYAPHEILGKTAEQMTMLEDQAVVLQARKDRRQGKTTSYENRLRHKDGHTVPVLITGVPRIKDDKYSGAIAVITDLTAIKEAERALRESEARYRAVVENQTEFIVRWKPDGTRTFVNEAYCRYFNLTPAQALATSFMPLVGEVDRRMVEEKIARMIANKGTREMDIHQVVRPDGQIGWQEWTDLPIYDEAGQLVEFQSVGRDITARKLAEDALQKLNAELEERVAQRTAQLEAANHELESFSYSVSHDLRAPLRAIDGFSTLLAQDYASQLDETGQKFILRIREGAHRMVQLIDDLLAFSRLGRHPLQKQTVDLMKLTRAVLEELHPEVEGRQVEWTIAELPACKADPALLRQVFVNLLSNALKYSRPRPITRIEIGWQPGQVYFVRDNGVGFDMEFADTLFGVFQRLHRQDEFEGTGVGLATVQRIIHRHGGRIWAEAAVEQGATFYFTLGEEEVKL